MSKTAIKAQKIFTETSIELNKYLLLEDDKFAGFIDKNDITSDIEVKDFPIRIYYQV